MPIANDDRIINPLIALIFTQEMPKYSDEEVKDIEDREAKALAMLKELQLTPAVSMQMVNIGGDKFAIQPFPFLQDMKYNKNNAVKSPDEFVPPKTA